MALFLEDLHRGKLHAWIRIFSQLTDRLVRAHSLCALGTHLLNITSSNNPIYYRKPYGGVKIITEKCHRRLYFGKYF